MRKLGPNEVRIALLGLGNNERSLNFAREFVDLTVTEIFARLNTHHKDLGGLPAGYWARSPCLLNRKELDPDQYDTTVLKAGDVLSVNPSSPP